MSKQHEQAYWAGDTTGQVCDVPECPNTAKITKISRTDEKIRLCSTHQNLTTEQVYEQHNAWLQSF